MNATEFRAALERLGFASPDKPNDLGLSECARFFKVNPRTVRDWAELGPPAGVEVALELMLKLKVSRAKAGKLLGR